MSRSFLGLAALLLLINASALAYNVRIVGGESSTIVVPDDFRTIQEAINNAFSGDTIFVKNGTYYEHVVVNKTVSLAGEDVGSTILHGNNTGHVVHVVSDYVNITRFTVRNSGSVQWPALDAGICLNSTTGCDVSGNRFVNNGFCGVSLLHSDQNTINFNNLSGVGWVAIHLLSSGRNIVSGNIIYDKYGGVNGHGSSNYNNITLNTIGNGTHGMFFHAANYNNICKNTVSHITEEGIWLQDQVSYNVVAENSLFNNTVAIRLQGPSHDNTLEGNIISDTEYGIKIENGVRSTFITGNTIMSSRANNDSWSAGIRLDGGSDTQIRFNTITENNYGVLLYSSSPSVSVFMNNIARNEFGLRVASGGSSYLNVCSNTVMNNRGYGIGLTGFGGVSNYASISRNLVMNNSDGIALGRYSSYHTIFCNNISLNGYGFYVEYSMQNTIWGNNIVGNEQQAYVSAGSVNSWDGGYLSGGNYWSGYSGADLFSGFHQNETGSDGVGDHSYRVNGGPQTPPQLVQYDNYPLMGPIHSFNDYAGASVCIISNSTLKSFECEPSSVIRFYVSNTTLNQTHGFCRVIIPREVMPEPLNVTVNGALPTYWNFNLHDNGTHRLIYFEYEHSTKEVAIIPEFPQLLILPLLMTIAVLTGILLRREK